MSNESGESEMGLRSGTRIASRYREASTNGGPMEKISDTDRAAMDKLLQPPDLAEGGFFPRGIPWGAWMVGVPGRILR